MTDTVKAWIEERRAARVPNSTLSVSDAHNNLPRALSALDSVLGLHVPKTRYGLDYYSGQYPCVECNMSDQEGLNPTPWPCPTVQAIEGAINELGSTTD